MLKTIKYTTLLQATSTKFVSALSTAPRLSRHYSNENGGGGNSGKKSGRARRKRTKMDRFFDLYANFESPPMSSTTETVKHPISPFMNERISSFKSSAGQSSQQFFSFPVPKVPTQQPRGPKMSAAAQKMDANSLSNAATIDDYSGALEAMLMDTNPRKIREHLDDYVIGQDAAKETISCAIYNHYTRVYHNLQQKKESLASFPSVKPTHLLDKSNILILGPSGSGKTLIAKRVAEILQVPFSMNDATSFTQAGYVGDDVEQCIARLIKSANSDIKQAEVGIIFIDEVDKITKRADATGSGKSRDVAGEGVQQALLKMLEGTTVYIKDPSAKKPEPMPVDTTNILFIFSGAFVGMDKVIQERSIGERSIGFGAKVSAPVSKEKSYGLSDINERDLIQYGLIPEFVGRVPLVVGVNRLTESELVRILHDTKNSLVEQYTLLFKAWRVDLKFTRCALKSIAKRVMDRSTGARGLKFVMEEILKEPMYRSPGSENIRIIRIDETLKAHYYNKKNQLLLNKGAIMTTASEQGMNAVLVNESGDFVDFGMPGTMPSIATMSTVPVSLNSNKENK